jgi:D-alanine-D-alanine ligase
MNKTRVGVLRGGPSSEYEVSLKSGEAVLKNMPDHYEAVDVFVDKNGVWHVRGIERKPYVILRHLDVVFNAMHGEYGEDGQVQDLLESFGMPYTGSRSFASKLAINKALAKSFITKVGVKTPLYKILNISEFNSSLVANLHQSFPQPSIVKPLSSGSSLGVSVARSITELADALNNAFLYSPNVLIEEYISGREATCAVVENFQGKDVNALPLVEIVPKSENGFFDFDAKYNGEAEEICPGRFSEEENREIARLAEIVHKTLDLKHYSRSDFIIHPRRGIYFLEVNALPGLMENTLLPKALKSAGSSLTEFIDHVIKKVLKK